MGFSRNAQKVGVITVALMAAARSRLTPILVTRNGSAVMVKPTTIPNGSHASPITHAGGTGGVRS
jgi:hypothetical protein